MGYMMKDQLLEPNQKHPNVGGTLRQLVEEAGLFSGERSTSNSAKYRPQFIANVLRIADVAALFVASLLGYTIRFGMSSPLSPVDHLFIYLSVIVAVVSLHFANSYRVTSLSSLNSHLSTLFVGGVSALFLIFLCGFFSGTLKNYSRIWIAFSILFATVLLLMNRIAITKILRHAADTKEFMQSVVIVGANEHAEKLIDAILKNPTTHFNILGIFDDRVERSFPAALLPRILGSTDNLLAYIRRNRVDHVLVALPWIGSERVSELLKKLRTVPVRIDLIPNDIIWQFSHVDMEHLGTVPLLNIANGRVEQQIGWIKRVEDISLSILMLILLCPLFTLIAVAIKLDSAGPALFKQKRHGFNNQIFEVYKFRSMKITDFPEVEIKQATRNDPRITRIGKILRRFSLDELPQLFNVLQGTMSIVGPRPHAVQHNIQYSSIISEYLARHNVKPGITGWAQVNGLRGETDTTEKMHLRVNADLYYIEHWSLLLDLKIILMTAISVWSHEAAY